MLQSGEIEPLTLKTSPILHPFRPIATAKMFFPRRQYRDYD